MRIGGVCYLRINGKLYTLGDGEFTFNVGRLKREAKLSSSGVAGFIEKPQAPYCEGEMIYTNEVEFKDLFDLDNATVTLELANKKTFVLHNAWFAGDGEVTSQGTVKVKFEGMKGEIV